MRHVSSVSIMAALLLYTPAAAQDRDPRCDHAEVLLRASIPLNNNRAELSGIVLKDDKLFTLSNEAIDEHGRQYTVQEFKGAPESGYQYLRDVLLYEIAAGACKEADFEALTRNGDVFFAIGSHSMNRKKQKTDNTYEKNRNNLSRAGIDMCESRDQLLKFKLDDSDKAEVLQSVSLRELISRNPVLSLFASIPNKENGIDIEGLAATPDALYIGFRGPVLRENYVPILRLVQDLSTSMLERSEILFVNLNGRGVRDIAPGPGGLYILAGPNGDERQSFAIYFWDGQDQVSGKDHAASVPDLLCDLGAYETSKPEGIAYFPSDTTRHPMRFILVYDGPAPLRAELVTIK